jgi:hypothetical protein
VFLALALFALMAVGLYAQTEADFDVSKSADGKSVTITSYEGTATAVNIPARIQNLPVTNISSNAFSGVKSKITSVTIPNGVTSIEGQTFSMCAQLTNVTIPSSVKSIGVSAFADSIRITSITIPASVTEIKNNAFNRCRGLTSVTFGGTIPSSGFHANAFNELGDIRDKYLAAGGGAGTYTRPNDESTTWTKGGSATAAPAAGTPGLKFDLTPDKKGYSVSRGTVTSGNVVIPASYNNLPVTTVPNSAFSGAALVTSLTIPASVTLIDIAGFTGCINLNSVTFGGANTRFGASEFPDGGDLLNKYKVGGAGTYTLTGKTWTKK